ncbi:acyltransferase [Dissulfurirhabdus thermomarina]|uniref:Acyltransferase n=2 Tax=Dissulfurirhabdus thermomarina TaxID=1765737 RepID=A0A6N9TJC2_DISTH|nr:acyltransferase [Dissulfurirhabdus thermomarina]NMX23266.1 acyltransferase [Dissulfurirhabdus thermomarina]
MTRMDSRRTTDTLKGVAVAAVVANHYLILHLSPRAAGFANAWIAVFFFLSGYGLYHSLARRGGGRWRDFYVRRLTRIYPLLWAAGLVELVLRRGHFSLWTFTGIHASGHYWFVPALLQCYLAAPVLFLGLRRTAAGTLLCLAAAAAAANLACLAFPGTAGRAAAFLHAAWRGVVFLHVLVFAAGMWTAARGMAARPPSAAARAGFWILAAGILAVMAGLKAQAGDPVAARLFDWLPVALILGWTVYALRFSVASPAFAALGVVSYPVYLFHMPYYRVVDMVTGGLPGAAWGAFACLAGLPLLFMACRRLEAWGGDVGRRMQARLAAGG